MCGPPPRRTNNPKGRVNRGMKLTVIGGGGVRSPLLTKSIFSRAGALGIDRVTLMDNDPERLAMYGALSRHIARRTDPNVALSVTTDADEALSGASYVITTMRVGGDEGRVLDERIPLSMGLLGQETTGAGGFAMAMRTIPALLDLCERAKRLAEPNVRIFNFTNPSGLVTQAMHDAGYDFVIGVCDGPSGYFRELERFTGTPHGGLIADCFGLNHFSWFPSVRRGGEELVGKLIADPALYTDTEARLFDPALVQSLGMIPNGYLYYYYHREKALESLARQRVTRGEAIRDINRRMSEALSHVDIENDFDTAIRVFLQYYFERENSYMTLESDAARGSCEQHPVTSDYTRLENDGYAGVALNAVRAWQTGEPVQMVFSVPNAGALPFLAGDDIVEVSCVLENGGVRPMRFANVPAPQETMIRQLKLYERLASRAIRARDRNLARTALSLHPLVGSWSLACRLVDAYIEAHKASIGIWK